MITGDAAPPAGVTEESHAPPSSALLPGTAVSVEAATAPTLPSPDVTRPPLNTLTTSLAVVLSSAAAAWMTAGLFRDFLAHLVALLGVLIGAGLVLLSYHMRPGRGLQYAVIPAAAAAGAALVGPSAGTGSSSLWGLVVEAVHNGGLLQPPLPFDPGWRFILVVLFAVLAAAATSLGIGLGRPKLGVAVTVPVIMGAGLVQPAQTEVATVAVSMALVGLGLSLAYGAELGRTGRVSAAFEFRRLMRGAVVALMLAVAVVGLSQLSILFPTSTPSRVIPPQKPVVPPVEADKVLFEYTAGRALPLRLGVLDGYDERQQAWLLPPYDVSRFVRLQPPAPIPGGPSVPQPGSNVVTVTVDDISGHQLPSVAGLEQIKGSSDAMAYDPRTNVISLADRPDYRGLAYTVVGTPTPTGTQLAAASAPPQSFDQYLTVPPQPAQVRTLITMYAQHSAELKVPEDPYDKLQYLRNALYAKVIAAGAGLPVDISAGRVAQMLDGGTATPYEITAAEGLLARWAGVPSRLGYGYYGGVAQKNGSFAVHPVDGAMWLETYFQGYGWVPIVGIPPRAQASADQQQKNNVDIAASDQLQLIVYIPVRHLTIEQLFELVRWWLVRIGPIVAGVALVLIGYPWPLKMLRRRRRRAWARKNGLEGAVLAAYAELRDRARDLAVGEPNVTPLKFLRRVAADAEHAELAWLVSRALWGDLRRDLREEDAQAAEQLAASVAKRIGQAQPALTRVLAAVARTSMREPYTSEIPNLWFEILPPLRIRGRLADRRLRRRRRAQLRRAGAVGVATLAAVLIASCGGAFAGSGTIGRALPKQAVQPVLDGYTFNQEKAAETLYSTASSDALVSGGLVYSIHEGSATVGAIEVSLFKPDVDITDIDDESKNRFCAQNPVECPGHEIFRGIESNFGSGHFHRLYYLNFERAYEMQLPDQRVYLWFPPGTETMDMLILLGRFPSSASDAMFHALISAEHHVKAPPVPQPSLAPASAAAAPSFGPSDTLAPSAPPSTSSSSPSPSAGGAA